mmetsp:Transcript_28747/g.62558  ORF Transcript_28747/g.62558 Transcript_28747/m.62558 type:complete len:286 (+) Transcript_28747:157-1014(+)
MLPSCEDLRLRIGAHCCAFPFGGALSPPRTRRCDCGAGHAHAGPILTSRSLCRASDGFGGGVGRLPQRNLERPNDAAATLARRGGRGARLHPGPVAHWLRLRLLFDGGSILLPDRVWWGTGAAFDLCGAGLLHPRQQQSRQLESTLRIGPVGRPSGPPSMEWGLSGWQCCYNSFLVSLPPPTPRRHRHEAGAVEALHGPLGSCRPSSLAILLGPRRGGRTTGPPSGPRSNDSPPAAPPLSPPGVDYRALLGPFDVLWLHFDVPIGRTVEGRRRALQLGPRIRHAS